MSANVIAEWPRTAGVRYETRFRVVVAVCIAIAFALLVAFTVTLGTQRNDARHALTTTRAQLATAQAQVESSKLEVNFLLNMLAAGTQPDERPDLILSEG